MWKVRVPKWMCFGKYDSNWWLNDSTQVSRHYNVSVIQCYVHDLCMRNKSSCHAVIFCIHTQKSILDSVLKSALNRSCTIRIGTGICGTRLYQYWTYVLVSIRISSLKRYRNSDSILCCPMLKWYWNFSYYFVCTSHALKLRSTI